MSALHWLLLGVVFVLARLSSLEGRHALEGGLSPSALDREEEIEEALRANGNECPTPLQCGPSLMGMLPRTKEKLTRVDPADALPDAGEPEPHVCVLARTHPHRYRYLPAFIFSWTQMDLSVTVFIVSTVEHPEMPFLKAIVHATNALAGPGAVELLPISLEDAKKRFPKLSKRNPDYGYAYTDASIDYLLSDASPVRCDYMVVTNGDNFYSSRFPEHIMPYMRQQTDLIAFDFVSSHLWPEYQRNGTGVFDNAKNKCLPIKFQVGRVDLGAMVLSMDFVRRTGIRFISNDPSQWLYIADGDFAMRAANLTQRKVRLAHTLFVHQ